MSELHWYYARNENRYGPVSASELKHLADTGQLEPDDLLWREGMDTWAAATSVRGLFDDGPQLATAATPPHATLTGATNGRRALRVPATTARSGDRHQAVLSVTQGALWILCVLVVLVGLGLMLRSFLAEQDPTAEGAAAAVFATLFIAAYVLARAGEKLGNLLRHGPRDR